MHKAALDGMGSAYLPLGLMQPHVDQDRLILVLNEWWPKVDKFTVSGLLAVLFSIAITAVVLWHGRNKIKNIASEANQG
ncbi:MAG: hypothetical protein GAK33_01721 [Burkholderia lata]|uniref:Uncharacterized protein n=2 Tax=Burkholderia lata (strain ATCC 17760 / DSM 23089 / LMG 22485 / NCIMB 9086 / R18194 / 383) TaxID=482957 RepID=A0A833PQI0_BURL3|nr:MAG: hypothetical protein GAK33_01721 [Burkholderia lata]